MRAAGLLLSGPSAPFEPVERRGARVQQAEVDGTDPLGFEMKRRLPQDQIVRGAVLAVLRDVPDVVGRGVAVTEKKHMGDLSATVVRLKEMGLMGSDLCKGRCEPIGPKLVAALGRLM